MKTHDSYKEIYNDDRDLKPTETQNNQIDSKQPQSLSTAIESQSSYKETETTKTQNCRKEI